MFEYVLKRLLWFIPTLFLVTLLGFILLVNAPGDPLDLLVNPLSQQKTSAKNIETQKTFWRKKLGLDIPVFYFSVMQLSEPDTLYKVYDKQKIKAFKLLLERYGNAESITHYFNALNKSEQIYTTYYTQFYNDTTSIYYHNKNGLNEIAINLNALQTCADKEEQLYHINTIKKNSIGFRNQNINLVAQIEESLLQLQLQKTPYKNYLPKFVWYGFNNRYHQWLKGIMKGDFGISYINKEPVLTVIKDKIIWSLFFSVLSIVLAYVISIPIGIKMAQKPNSRITKVTQLFLFIIYAMPSFFIGVLLIMLFANSDLFSLFPASGIKPVEGYNDNASWLEKAIDSLPYIILPLICYTYSSLAYISKLTQTAVNNQLNLDYIKTARAKGLTENSIIWKHAFKNSLLPLITVFSSVFPAIIGGSVIIETVFTIPGMGTETVNAIISKDYPIVIAIILLSSVLTILSYLIADILYALADPRIRYK